MPVTPPPAAARRTARHAAAPPNGSPWPFMWLCGLAALPQMSARQQAAARTYRAIAFASTAGLGWAGLLHGPSEALRACYAAMRSYKGPESPPRA